MNLLRQPFISVKSVALLCMKIQCEKDDNILQVKLGLNTQGSLMFWSYH